MTKEELENGWVSLNRAQLFWSYYLIIISLVLITLNIVIIYLITTYKKSFTSFKTHYYVILGTIIEVGYQIYVPWYQK